MTPDSRSPRVLVSVANDMAAAAIVSALADRGIVATAAGGYTSGFQTAAPGDVQVLVGSADLDRAREILSAIRREQSEIDWSNIDVGEPE